MNKIVNLIRYIGKYFNNKQKTRLYLTILVCILSSIINSISPVILSKLIDQLNYVFHSEKFYELIFYSIIYIVILILGRLLPILSNITLMFSQIDRKLVLSHSFMTYLYCQNESFFEKNNAGAVSQRAVQLNNEMHILFNTFITGLCDPLCRLIFSMLIIFWSGDLIVFLLFIVYILCSIISTQYFTKNLTLIKNKLMESGRRSYQIQTDSVENINVTKNNNAFDFVFNRYARILDEEKESALVYAKWTNYMSITNALLSVLLFGGCFIYTLYGVIENSYTIGYFVMILSYIVMLSQPIEGLANSYSQIKQSLSFLDDFIQKFIEDTPWKENKNILQINSPIRIKLENVYFHYPNKNEDVLKNINLDICDSKFITFTGYSGSGKTTLVKLLSLHIDGYQGSIKINNEDIRNYTQDSLKQNIYYVTQDEFIFMDTLRFNLLVAKPNATDDELVSALLLANFSYQNIDKINKDILDMELGNKGMSLSGGQKQRISLARLFLRNPQLIIIDESTSALDVMNEKIILENIIRTFPHAIKISISHRPTTFTYSDVIYIFENGEIVDSGTLENLLKRNYYIQTIVQQVNETSERELEG